MAELKHCVYNNQDEHAGLNSKPYINVYTFILGY